ncbi:MAG TPA: hypothetical protein VFO46_20510 [Candidatus Sulfotelmatobacter sp.]|nr:hypothetical protein [Candidatus Sulfotelmatobacter sp.]
MTSINKASLNASMSAHGDGPKRLVIVGATGMVGGYALRFALDNLAVKSVTSIGRKRSGITHPKLKEVLHQNFADCSPLADVLSAQDAVVYCLGTYTGSVSDEQLRVITADYTIEFARVFRDGSPNAAFSFLSGNGADPSGRSRLAFAGYKGQAENAILAGGFPRVYIFRPAYIYPVEPRREPNLSYRFLRAVYPVFRVLFPNQVIRADDLGRVMVDLPLNATEESRNLILENREIQAMVKSLHRPAVQGRSRTNQPRT